jgi:hypothetical protein
MHLKATVAFALTCLLAGPAIGQVRLGDDSDFRSAIPLEIDLAPTIGSPGSSTGTGQPPRIGTNVRVNAPQRLFPAGLIGRSETTIAAASGGSKLVAGWNDADGFCGAPFFAGCTVPPVPGLSGFGYCSNGGVTWIDGGAPPLFGKDIITRGDPWLDVGGADGQTFFYANLAVKQNGVSVGVSVHRGRFNGPNFAWFDVQAFDSPRNAIRPEADFYDKEAIATGKGGSKSAFVSVTNFQEICDEPQFGFGQIEVWRTHDGGETWQGPAIAGPEPADSVASCGNLGTLQQSSVPAVGPGGEVYVVWQYGPSFTPAMSTSAQIVVARSLDGGATFEPFTVVANINTMRANPPVGYNRPRINDHPRIDVAQDGPFRGRVYVAYYTAVSPTSVPVSQQNLVSSEVYVSHSDDRGLTWSTPTRVAPAVPATGLKRFWPVVTVQPGGNVDVVFYESEERLPNPASGEVVSTCTTAGRTGPNHSFVNTWWASSSNGGATFSRLQKVSEGTTDWCRTASNIIPNFGDYIGSASTANRVFPCWADGSVPFLADGRGIPEVFMAPIKTGPP